MKVKNTGLQHGNNTMEDLPRTDYDKHHKGYNEQNPTQPHGSFKPDGNPTKKAKPTSVKKRSKEKDFDI
ncbi:MAG TPA: hypothetical protein VKR53_09255 [Puia sp.]|nr:hypothetical protein [Puia sp.]